MPKLTVLIPSFNSDKTIRKTLESVKWADEIVLCDSFSTDKTMEIAREYGARILQKEYVNSAVQKNWAIPQCAHPWVLQVDTDEVLEEALIREIKECLSREDGVDGYWIPFKNHVLGKWVKTMDLYPSYHLRLFKRDSGRFEEKEVHAHVRVKGRAGKTKNHILHYGMPNISKQLANVDRYARYQADELRKRGKVPRWHHFVMRPLAVFAYYYLWKRGFMDGYRGLFVSAVQVTYDFWAHAKLWELKALGLEKSPA